MKYYKETKYLWNTYVPKKGQALTVQGELVRAVEKLRDEAQRNGNINWDNGHEILSDYVYQILVESDIFDEISLTDIKKKVDRIKDYDNPYVEDDLYNDLLDYIVEWYKNNQEPIERVENPDLHR